MKRQDSLLALAVATGYVIPLASAAAPRGVGPEFAKYYASTDTFTCISNPSITISTSQINDDFCDCPDGSDEPGTSACSYLSSVSPRQPYQGVKNTTLALPGFYCENKGHKPSYIPFTYVNDGICDYEVCCDGTDEWEAVGDTKCANKCTEIGKEWRKEQEARQASLNAAVKARQSLVEQAARLKLETQSSIKDVTTQIAAAEKRVQDAKKEYERIERVEKARSMASAGDKGRAQMLAREARDKMSAMSSLLAVLQGQRDDYYARVEQLEGILRTFHKEYNPNFNDEGVKRAVQGWQDYEADGNEKLGDEISEQRITEYISQQFGIDFDQYENSAEVEDDVQAIYSLQKYLPASLQEFLNEQLSSLRQILIDNGILSAPPATEPGAETKAVKDARTRLNSAESDLTKLRNDKTASEEKLNKDYGPDDVFRPLDGSCVSLDSGEYTYELCWMNKVKQISKKGGAAQNMGSFTRFDKTVVDDEERADGKGLGSGERLTMKFENGNHCWNGPDRETTVVLACAEKPEVWKVTEEEKCVYRMEAGTPAVCDKAAVGETSEKQQAAKKRDEL